MLFVRFGLLWAALFGIGCVGTASIRAERASPEMLAHLEPERSPYPDAVQLIRDVPRPGYFVGPGDELSIHVFGRTDLGSQVLDAERRRVTGVDESGSIALPFLGPLQVSGETGGEIAERVRQLYRKIMDAPQVEVRLLGCRSRSVDVEGAVKRPGRYHLCPDFRSVGDALGAAGGMLPEANSAWGILRRGAETFRLDLRNAQGALPVLEIDLQGGDAIYVPFAEERTVYVFGEVERPGAYPVPGRGLSLQEALALVGGVKAETGNSDNIVLLRPTGESVAVYRLGLSNLLEGPEVYLRGGDRLFVPPTLLARWFRWWKQAIPQFLVPSFRVN